MTVHATLEGEGMVRRLLLWWWLLVLVLLFCSIGGVRVSNVEGHG